jgi:hypothetical protein
MLTFNEPDSPSALVNGAKNANFGYNQSVSGCKVGERVIISLCGQKYTMGNVDIKKHPIFSELSEYISFYKSLSLAIFQFSTLGTTAICNIDSCVISSIQGTIESIRLILKDGKINDAYALTRKYHDSVVINIYECLYLKKHCSIDNFIVKKINDWLHGKAPLPRYRQMKKLITESPELYKINELLDLENYYKEIRERCNDHTHYNFFSYMMMNDNQVHIEKKSIIMNDMSKDIRDIFIKHFVLLFTINGHYMTSSDYIDSLECGLEPEEGSQYFVAPFIQNCFDNIIKKHRNDLAVELKSSTFMDLE